MILAKRLIQLSLRSQFLKTRHLQVYLFCDKNNLNPTYQAIKDAFTSKGRNSKQYQQQMAKAIRDALIKYDYPQAINIQLFHLKLIKESEGQTSEGYRDQLREIIRFSINRFQFQVAEKLAEQLRQIQQKIPDISPLDIVSTRYVQGHIYSELGKLDESKKCLNQCVQMKHVKQAPEVYFKVFAQLTKVHIKAGQKEQAYKKLASCEQFLQKRQIDPKSPQFVKAMDLHDVFILAQIASSMQDKNLALKYMQMYKQRMGDISNTKDNFYAEYLERISKVHFNLKQYEDSVKYLEEAANLSDELGKTNKNFLQNAKVMRNIIDSITKQYINKKQ